MRSPGRKHPLFQKLNLDERDLVILEMYQKNPFVSQQEIGNAIGLSQPSVGARLRNLRERGILNIVSGVNYQLAGLQIAKVELTVGDTRAVIQEFGDCPHFVNALVTSGRSNLCLMLMATDIAQVEQILRYHLVDNPDIKDIELDFVMSSAKDLVFPVNWDFGCRCTEDGS